MAWRTYLVMYFGTNNETSITDIVKKVEKLGFSSAIGPVDFVYDWEDKQPEKDDIFSLGNKLKEVLRGTGTIFNLDTNRTA